MDNIDITPEAYYDILVLMTDAPTSVLPLSYIEIHLFSYLSCVLALSQGQAIEEWGYKYSVTTGGIPFSVELDNCLKHIENTGCIYQDANGLFNRNDNILENEISILSEIKSWGNRRYYLKAAVECALALPIGSIRGAISTSPGMDLSVRLQQSAELLESDDIDKLYNEYQIITSILGHDFKDLLSPAVMWLSARIIQQGEI
jgi:hypothetical protein